MARVKEIVSEAEIRFSDGRRYYVANDSVVEFILHPTFLKYLLGCILIYALLDRGASDTGRGCVETSCCGRLLQVSGGMHGGFHRGY